MSTKAVSIVMAGFAVTILALAGALVLVRQSSATDLGRQARQITQQASEIATLQKQVTAAQQLAKTQSDATRGAVAAHLGICVSTGESSTDSIGATYTALQSYDISSPQMTAGVAACPNGSFVSVVPGKN
jgi:type II secretory pathway pseudopilin PulG